MIKIKFFILGNGKKNSVKYIEERRKKSKDVIEIILLEHNRSACLKNTEENDLVNGILSIPHEVLIITLKLTQNIWGFNC